MNYTDISITKSDNRLYVKTPYNAAFVKKAKELSGRWEASAKEWYFNEKQEEFVREALLNIFGTDGTPCDVVTIELNFKYVVQYGDYQTLWFGSIPLASRSSRDSRVQLKSGAYLISGYFARSGGTLKYPILDNPSEDIKIRVEVPRKLFEDYKKDGVVLCESKAESLEKLQKEKDNLMKRLAEVEKQINDFKKGKN